MKHIHFEPNTVGTDYVVGDIHGCYATYMSALDKIGFDVTKDRMFSVGDLVDRGAHSLTCVQLLNLPYFHAVRGNHEQMAIDYVDFQYEVEFPMAARNYSANGGDWFLDCHPDLQKVITDKFRELPVVITVGNVAIVHADPVYTDFDRLLSDLASGNDTLVERVTEAAMWSRNYVNFYGANGITIEGINKMFLGHTPQPQGVKVNGNMYFIDTGSVFGHTLTICKLDGTVAVSEPNVDARYKSKTPQRY